MNRSVLLAESQLVFDFFSENSHEFSPILVKFPTSINIHKHVTITSPPLITKGQGAFSTVWRAMHRTSGQAREDTWSTGTGWLFPQSHPLIWINMINMEIYNLYIYNYTPPHGHIMIRLHRNWWQPTKGAKIEGFWTTTIRRSGWWQNECLKSPIYWYIMIYYWRVRPSIPAQIFCKESQWNMVMFSINKLGLPWMRCWLYTF